MASELVAVVTGANKGIGFEIVRGLLKNQRQPIKVILCSRDEDRGKQALISIQTEFQDRKHLISYEPLDLGNPSSVSEFAQIVNNKYRRLDILIHNAAIAFLDDDQIPLSKQVEPVLNTNYFSTLSLNQQLLPLLKKSSDPRVVFVSSTLGDWTFNKCSDIVKNKFRNIEKNDSVINEFISICKTDGEEGLTKNGFGLCYGVYGTSKLALTAKVKHLSEQSENKNIFMVTMCPGYCSTDLNKHSGTKTAEEGADTAVYLALLSKEEREKMGVESGEFWCERKNVSYL